MRLTISINDPDVQDHIEELRANRTNISGYIVNCIKRDMESNDEYLKELIREVINESGPSINMKDENDEPDSEKDNLKNKLNDMFDNM